MHSALREGTKLTIEIIAIIRSALTVSVKKNHQYAQQLTAKPFQLEFLPAAIQLEFVSDVITEGFCLFAQVNKHTDSICPAVAGLFRPLHHCSFHHNTIDLRDGDHRGSRASKQYTVPPKRIYTQLFIQLPSSTHILWYNHQGKERKSGNNPGLSR